MTSKVFRLPADQIREVAPGRGSCIAPDTITVDGNCVRYMYRDEPDNDIDSGWRFFAGTESQEYADNPANYALYDVNTIANYDPDIVPLLDSPFHSAFERDVSGTFVAVPFPTDPDTMQ